MRSFDCSFNGFFLFMTLKRFDCALGETEGVKLSEWGEKKVDKLMTVASVPPNRNQRFLNRTLLTFN